jgi:hypothetical protein
MLPPPLESDVYHDAIIDNKERIPFSANLFARRSERYIDCLLRGEEDIHIDATFRRESVARFLSACQDLVYDPKLEDVFEVELLCDQWKVTHSAIRDPIAKFIDYKEQRGTLPVARLLFRLAHHLDTSEAETHVRRRLPTLLKGRQMFRIPPPILLRIVDFQDFEDDPVSYARLFAFCVEYFESQEEREAPVPIFNTLDIARLTDEEVRQLPNVQGIRPVFPLESAVCTITELRRELAGTQHLRQELANLTASVKRMLRNPGYETRRDVIQRVLPQNRNFPLPEWIGTENWPAGIIEQLVRESDPEPLNDYVLEVTSSDPVDRRPCNAAKNITKLRNSAGFQSQERSAGEEVPHRRNNWVCYDLKERRFFPAGYAIRSCWEPPGGPHMKSWVVETSIDGRKWRKVDRRTDTTVLNTWRAPAVFPTADDSPARFIRLTNIGRNHAGTDRLWIEAWEIFGILLD